MSEPVLAAEGIWKIFEDGGRRLEILRGADFAVQPGETVAVMGRSGTGKSTLLHLLGLLDRPTRGAVRLDGQSVGDLPDRRRAAIRGRRVGFVFQQYHLLADLAAGENVALGASVARGGWPGGAHRARARRLLAAVGLAERFRHAPRKLSGGEQQRVAIARALAGGPRVLLCDEPTGNLDPETGAEVMETLFRAAREEGTAMVLVTHDPLVARRADRVLRLGDGRLSPAETV
jgi:predicted ABC-type transport system involved in lysophospholipase L1 biosynthesis ATPase subunit